MQVAPEGIVARRRQAVVRSWRHTIIRRRRHAIVWCCQSRAWHDQNICSETLTSKPSMESRRSTKGKAAIGRETWATMKRTGGASEISDSARLGICALRGGNYGENGGREKH